MNIGDLFFTLRSDGKKLEADITRQAKVAGDRAGKTLGQSMGQSLGKSLNQNLGKGVSNAIRNVERLAVAGGALAIGGGAMAVKWAGEFEAQLNTINTIARETPEGLRKIGDSIRAIARETGTPLEELTQGYYDLLSAGVAAADAPKVLAEANKLAIGGLATAAEGVDLLTTAINVYGGDASQAAQFTDEFAKAIEHGKVTAAELAESYAQVAPLAKSLGIENKELAAGYATLTAAGTPAAEASTQMASALTALLKKTPSLEKLEKATKKNYAAIAGSKGLNVALEEMRVDADKAGLELVDLVGRKEALLYILQTTGPNLRSYNEDLAAMGDAAGTAAAQMAERQQGLNFQLARAKALFKDAGITIGTALLPKLIPLIERFNQFITGNQEGIKRFGTDLANAFEGAAQWVMRLDFESIANSLKLAGTFAKGLIQAFLAAPQWLQAAVVTGWGLNKLTGGAVANIFGDLAKTAFGHFAARGSSPANPMYVSDVAGGLGDGIGGKNGIVSKIALAIAAVLPVIALKESGAIDGLVNNINTAIFGNKKGDALAAQRQHETGGGTGAPLFGGRGVGAFEPGGIFGPKVRPPTGNRSGSPDDRQARSDLHELAQAALEEHRRGERGIERTEAVEQAVTAMHHALHADLSTAVDVLRTSTDPAAIAAAVEQAVASITGGAGSAGTTQGLIGDLTNQLRAAEAANNPDLAAKIKAAIAQLEPFAKGRQWQSEQLTKAQAIVTSNQTTAEKVTALKGIQSDLLSHQRTMAAGIVGKLIDVERAVKNIKINASTGFSLTGPYSTPPKPKPKPKNVSGSPDERDGFAKGSWDVPANMIADIHKGEMILPARLAKLIRRAIGLRGPFVPTVRLDPSQMQDRRGMFDQPMTPPGFGYQGEEFARRARGGPVTGGHSYWVGEEGPELYVPRMSGKVVPVVAGPSGGPSGGDTYQLNVQGLIPYRDPLDIVHQQRRMRDFVVATPRRRLAGA